MTKVATRRGAITLGAVVAVGVGLGGHALAGRDQRTSVSIWKSGAAGGYGYGGAGAPGGAFVTHRREVEIAGDGAVKFPGVTAGIDPATVEFRSVTDPAGTAVVEQRFVNDLLNAEALLHRQLGKPVTVVLARGEVAGTLRAVSAESLVIETAAHGLEIVRRGDHVVDIRLGAASFDQEPTLEWKVITKKPGKHTVDVSYRTAGLSWQPEYTAVLGDGDAVDFTAWATVSNQSGLALDRAELTLVAGTLATAPVGARAPIGAAPPAPVQFKVARPADLPSGQAMQVELAPRRAGVAARRRIVLEAIADQSPSYQTSPAYDCYAYTPGGGPRAEQMLELDGGGQILPEGRLRVFRRQGAELLVVGEDTLRVNRATGALRLRVGVASELTAERRQVECRQDGGGRSMRSRIEVRIENKGKAATDVVVREYLYRWSNWKIEAEDVKGARAGGSAYEFVVKVPAGASKAVSYTVVYSW
ncbi:MAG TPA: DUF4139 domain-containing protein [Kofleriaceae bacterium]|nr:DUF4139 domain-containing protein [Kofleriaceae bacterium]